MRIIRLNLHVCMVTKLIQTSDASEFPLTFFGISRPHQYKYPYKFYKIRLIDEQPTLHTNIII